MNRLITFLLCIAFVCTAMAQINVSGRVTEKGTGEPLMGASLIIKDAGGKIKKYASSQKDGGFTMSVPSVTECRLEVAMMNYTKKTIPLDSIELPLTVELEPGTTMLKEVTVKADRIREQGDTISYLVGSFAQQQDRSIGDVLKRMPGINVEKSGKIQYQGADINKFYIEGSDLLGGKYGLATNGINHEDVGAVEVMENHQPMQVLSGISFSDKAAINLKLKDRAKATWTFHGDAAGGYSWQPEGAVWQGELFAMAVMPNFQSITTFKINNVGEDLSAEATDFFVSGRSTDLNRYLSISLPGVPNLNRNRTLFNRSALVSTNALWKLGRGEFKSQIDYSFNRVTAEAASITAYFLNDGNRIVTEDRNGVDRTHSLSGKFMYELNQKAAYINNTLKTNLDWDNVRLRVAGSLPNNQTASLPDYYVGNDFKLIQRFNGKHLVTFTSRNEWESLPQSYSVAMNEDLVRQHIKDHAFYTDESAAYAFSVKGITISLEGGINGYFRSMRSEISGFYDLSDDSGYLTNVVNTNYLTLYATPKFEYWVKHINITLVAPVSYSHYTFDKALANRNELYFAPSLSVDWKLNNRISMGLGGGIGRSPMDLSLVHTGYVMTDYRSFSRGVNDFYCTTSQNVSADFRYKHTRHGLFANASLIQSWSRDPYTMVQQLYGDYVAYSYASAKNDSQMLMTNGNIGKTLDFMHGSANVNGAFRRTEYHLISEGQTVHSVGTAWSVGAKINGTPFRWLSIDYRFEWSANRLAMNDFNASWLSGMENEVLLNIIPHRKWEWRIIGEHYHNELTADKFKNMFLLDTKVIFKLNKQIELSASLSNIFNQRTYNYTTYTQLTSFESRRWLRGRELLISISIRK